MRKLFLYGILFLMSFFVFGNSLVRAEGVPEDTEGQKIEYVLFHLETCPHCRDEIKFIERKLIPKYGNYIDLKMYEVSSVENQKIFAQYQQYYNVRGGGVPVAVIDGEVVYGYGNDDTTGKQIMGIVESKLTGRGLIQQQNTDSQACEDGKECINVPVLGRIDATSFSLPILTVVLGFLDGFNPCAMWVLLFLISLLLGMEDRKRMWLLGSIFIITSGLVYFIFMAAWLQLLLFIGMIFAIRLIIGLVGIGVGIKNIRDWWDNRKADGIVCKVSKNTKTQSTFAKIKNIVHRKSLWWSLIGIILLGLSVNLVELACSAGFPAIYTQILALSGIPAWERYLYMVGYIFFYMLDDMAVFILAMLTLKSQMVGTKYAKYANLAGGIIILILGLLLIFRPEWIMFG